MLFFTLPLSRENTRKLEGIYHKYSKLMKYIAYEILLDDNLADDAVCDAFLKIIKHADKLDDVESTKVKSFVAMTVKSAAIDIIRKRKKYRFTEKIPHTSEMLDVSLAELNTVIESLSEPYREILILKAYYSFSDNEIADFYGISHSSARKRIQRARGKLNDILNEKG